MDVVLIGPIAAGKSTIGKLLSAALGLPHCSIDDVRFGYYSEIGYDDPLAKRLYESEGFWDLHRYWKPFEAHAVERVLEDHPNSVIDLGAGHSVYLEIERCVYCKGVWLDAGEYDAVRKRIEVQPPGIDKPRGDAGFGLVGAGFDVAFESLVTMLFDGLF